MVCKGQSSTPQSHPYTRSALSTPQIGSQSSYFSSNVRTKQIGSHPNLSIDTIIESDSTNSSNQQSGQPPPPSFFLRSSSAMCQNKTLSQLQNSSIEQFSQKASLAASAPHLIDDVEQPAPSSADKQAQEASATASQPAQAGTSQQPAANGSNQQPQTTNASTSTASHPPQLNRPPLPLQSDFTSTASIASSSIHSQLPDNGYPFRNPSFYPPQYLPHPRNLANINNHLNLNKRLPTYNLNANNAQSNSHMALRKLYRVLYPYKPQQGDELELFAGDIVSVTDHCDDGWYIGFSTLTGSRGTFPGNYCAPLH